MNENFERSDAEKDEEDVKNENDFLKMKLILEQSAQFGSMQTDGKLPAEIENQFLKNIIEFEKQFEEHRTIKIFDKIERPDHFKPANEIPDDEIETACDELDEYVQKYGIQLSVRSPNISKRELYRFTTEELFDHEMDDMNMPGMMTCFTYDEFYPDHKYHNTRHAIEDCIGMILRKDPVEWMPLLPLENLRINDRYPLTEKEFKAFINRFKEAYEDIVTNEINDTDFSMDEKVCEVKGIYDVILKLPSEEINLKDKWSVEFNWDGDYWEVVNVQVEEINF